MGDYKRDSEQDNSMDCPIWGTDDISDEELLKEFEAVKNMAVPLPIPSPSPDEFEKIWARIQEERAESKKVPESDQPEHPKVIKPRFGWKRLAAVGLIACLVAGSGCMVAMGTKSYFYREKKLNGEQKFKILVNDTNRIEVNGEDEAYTLIEQDLGIKVLKLGYIPTGMIFDNLVMDEGYSVLEFEYDKQPVYFIQSKSEIATSGSYISDGRPYSTLYNKWLQLKIEIKKEDIAGDMTRFECQFLYEGAYYWFFGVMDEADFTKIVQRIYP